MKNDTLKISFVTPVYNGAKYLSVCLDSIYCQGLREEEFEVICVDDCSQDDSLQILRKYEAAHSNMRIIAHDHNMKVGTSCKQGFDAAKGEYIWTVDQDDWIKEGCVNRLLAIAKENKLDVLLFNYNRVNPDGDEVLSKVEVFKESEVRRGQDYVRQYYYDTLGQYLMGYGWRAMYRNDHLRKYGITYPEGVIYEDTTFMFKAIWYAAKVKSTNQFVYNYRLNATSISDYNNRYKGFLTYEYSFVTSAELLAVADEVGDAHVADLLRQTAQKTMRSFVWKVIPMSCKERKIFYDNIRQSWSSISKMIRLLPLQYRVLSRPLSGFVLSACLKPIFILKSCVSKKDKRFYK